MEKFYIFSYKKIVLLIFFISFAQVPAQMRSKDFSHIMKSKSIYQIDGFLRVAHPNDSKRLVLKPRLVELITEYLKYAHPADSRIPELQEKLALLKTKNSSESNYNFFK